MNNNFDALSALTFASTSDQRSDTELNLSVGIVQPLSFPYNLLLSVPDLMDPDVPYVYFYVYILGGKRVVFWGLYDKTEQQFIIEDGCRYATNQLSTMVKIWTQNQNIYAGNSVKDRTTETMARYVTPKEKVMTYSEYLQGKFLIGYFQGKINQTELEKRYPNLLEIIENTLQLNEYYDEDPFAQYIEDLNDQIIKYEKTINMTDVNRDLLSQVGQSIGQVVQRITNRFYDFIKSGQFEMDSFVSSLNQCPGFDQCSITYSEGCEVYFYGQEGYRSDLDLRRLL